MQKVRYCLSFNNLYIKFQVLFHFSIMITFNRLFTLLLLWMFNILALEIDFSIFDCISSFYNLLRDSGQKQKITLESYLRKNGL